MRRRGRTTSRGAGGTCRGRRSAHAAVDAELRKKNRGRPACEVANSKALSEIGGQFRIDDLDRNEGEEAEDPVWCRWQDCHFGRGAHRVLRLKCDAAKIVGYRQLATIEGPSIVLATEGFQAKVDRLVTQLI